MVAKNGSKIKGSGFERTVAKFLSECFGVPFTRVLSSGSFLGRKNSFRKANLSANHISSAKSDIFAPETMSRLVIECKFYKDFLFHQLLRDESNVKLDSWIEQILASVDPGDFWLIVFKINLRGSYVVVPRQLSEGLVLKNYSTYNHAHDQFYITDMESFFKNNIEAIREKSK